MSHYYPEGTIISSGLSKWCGAGGWRIGYLIFPKELIIIKNMIRKYRKEMEKEGLDTSKIIKTVNNLLSANKALNFYKNKSLNNHVSFISKNKCLINNQIFLEEAGEIVFKSFSDILSLISGTYYPPRSKKIVSLINRLKKNKFSKSTLGGCVIEKKDNIITIFKETKELRIKKMHIQP